jgi:hypothetical protein
MAQFSVKIIRLNGAVLDENQQRLSSMPVTQPFVRLSMLSSFWCAVLQERNQLFKTMK